MLEALYDPAILPTTQIQRFLNQFEHDLHNLKQDSPSTKIGRLQRLNPHDRLQLLEWNSLMSQMSNNPASTDKLLDKVHDGPLRNFIKLSCGFWILTLRDNDFLVPIGSIGDLSVEVTLTSTHQGCCASMNFQPPSISPKWFEESSDKTTCLLNTGYVVKYDQDGTLIVVGKRENRIRLANRVVQLEQVEEKIGASNRVTSIMVVPKIVAGRTRLNAVLTLAGFDDVESSQEPFELLSREVSFLVDDHVESVRSHAATLLPSDQVPSIWRAVGFAVSWGRQY